MQQWHPLICLLLRVSAKYDGKTGRIREVCVGSNGAVVFHKAAKKEEEIGAFGVRKQYGQRQAIRKVLGIF